MSIRFVVKGRPVPFVRVTRKSIYLNKNVQRYLDYKERVNAIAKKHFSESSNKLIGIKATFYIHGVKDGEIEAYGKSISEALKGIAYQDIQQIDVMHLRIRKAESELDQHVQIKVYELGDTT